MHRCDVGARVTDFAKWAGDVGSGVDKYRTAKAVLVVVAKVGMIPISSIVGRRRDQVREVAAGRNRPLPYKPTSAEGSICMALATHLGETGNSIVFGGSSLV